MVDTKENLIGYSPVYGLDQPQKEVVTKIEYRTNWIQLIFLCLAFGFIVGAFYDIRYKGKDTNNLEKQIEQLRKQGVENQKILDQLRGLACPTR